MYLWPWGECVFRSSLLSYVYLKMKHAHVTPKEMLLKAKIMSFGSCFFISHFTCKIIAFFNFTKFTRCATILICKHCQRIYVTVSPWVNKWELKSFVVFIGETNSIVQIIIMLLMAMTMFIVGWTLPHATSMKAGNNKLQDYNGFEGFLLCVSRTGTKLFKATLLCCHCITCISWSEHTNHLGMFLNHHNTFI